MGEERKDKAFRITGIASLVVLLLFTLWMREDGVHRPDEISKPATAGHDHDDPAHHGSGMSAERPSGQSGILHPSGKLADGIREVSYEAFQYGFDPDPMVVRAGDKVRLLVKSRDVEHGMMIPEVGFNATMPVGETKAVEFTAPIKAGEYPIFCSVFCGTGHGAMKGTLTVLPADDHGDSVPASAQPDSGDGHGRR